MAIIKYPYGLEGKILTKAELGRYFDAPSLDAMLLDLRMYRRSGYLDFAVSISPDYFDWERARYELQMSADVLEPYDPFGALKRSPFGIYYKPDTPLSDTEIKDAVSKLPSDMAERYLRFKLHNIDLPQLKDALSAAPVPSEDIETLEYNGLAAHGSEITFHGATIAMPFQQRQLLRAFMSRPETLIAPDELIEDPDIFSPSRTYSDPYKTLSKLVAEVHTKLRQVIGSPCIFNEPKEGWRLQV